MPSRRQTAFIAVGSAAATFVVMAATRPEPRVLIVSADGTLSNDAAMHRVLPLFEVKGVPYREALQQWSKQAGVGLVVHEKTLESAGVDLAAPVSLRLLNVTAGGALDALRDFAGNGPVAPVTWQDAGQMHLSTADERVITVATRLYNVGGLIRYLAGKLPQRSSTAGQRPAVFSYAGSSQTSGATPEDEAAEWISQAVRDQGGTGTWKEEGGSIGSLRVFGDWMVVTQTPDNHDRITALLHTLEYARANGQTPNFSTTLPSAVR